MKNLDIKTAVVTGSTAGIGKSIALDLAGQGYSVLLNGRRDENEVQPLMDELDRKTGRKGSSAYIKGDLHEKSTRDSIIETIEMKFGHLDLLVNNAAVTTAGRKDLLEIEEDDMIYLLKVNLVSPFLLTSSLVPLLKESSETSYIINISSISAYTVSTNRADYCMSKAGMSMMTEQFAARLADENIKVFEIRPGIIKTDMTSGVREKYEALIKEGLLPIKRMGEPEDVSRAVLGIVKGYFPYSTGQVIDVDGGFHIRRL